MKGMHSAFGIMHNDARNGVMEMGTIQYAIFIVWAISLVLMVTFILMHSGKGSGFSDIAATSLYSSKNASAVMEKNLNRLTNVSIFAFVASIFACILFFPLGTI